MSYLFKSASLVALDPCSMERADLRIDGPLISDKAAQLEPREDDEVIDLAGKLVMPGLVCAHTHLYSALARGMPAPPRAPLNFREILELIWWRLDRALDEETIYWSAVAGALDAARAGTTCLFDHHASPAHISGSLQIVREALEMVGLRAVLCYEVTDRGGTKERDEAIEENRAFIEWANTRRINPQSVKSPDLFRGMVGAHASFTLSDRSLEQCAAIMAERGAGLHIHAAEDMCDVEEAREKYGLGVVERLAGKGALNAQTILAHGVHLTDSDIEIARSAGAWFAHNPRSNLNNRVGYAKIQNFGERVLMGTDGIGADMFEEARVAFLKGREEATGFIADDWMRVLANNQRMAANLFGIEMSRLERGAAADLVVLDYDSPTVVTSGNLAWHFIFGLNSASVESVMVGGRFLIKERKSALDEDDLYSKARKASERLWAALQKI